MLSNLTAEQRNTLQTMQPILGLAADIAHASITIYLQAEDKRFYNIYKQVRPRTQVGSVQPDMTGRRIRTVEEPIVSRCLQSGLPMDGKKELVLGTLYGFKVYPLKDGAGRTFAALSFDGARLDDIIVAQSFELLCNLRRSVEDNSLYSRLSPTDGLMVVDANKLIIAANRAAKHIFQSMDVRGLIGSRTNDRNVNWPLVGMVIDTGTAEGKEFNVHGRILSMRVLPVVERPRGGCAIVIISDITELRKKDEELLIKSVVIKEIHHRVKNNLQTITSLLRLQARRAQSEETKLVLRDCIGRVSSIAIVHEYLSQQDSGLIDVGKVAKGIYQAILSSMLNPDFKLEAEFFADQLQLPSEKATSIALILNELLQNIIEHAFEGKMQGRLEVSFTEKSDAYYLTITDDGIGIPADFDISQSKSLGLKIIRTLAESDLHGSFTLKNRPEGGAVAQVIIPKAGGQ